MVWHTTCAELLCEAAQLQPPEGSATAAQLSDPGLLSLGLQLAGAVQLSLRCKMARPTSSQFQHSSPADDRVCLSRTFQFQLVSGSLLMSIG